LLSGEKRELRRSYEMLDRLKLTRSQPDLTRLAELCVPQQHLALPAPSSQDGQTSPQQQHKQLQQQLQQQQLQQQHKQQTGQTSVAKLSPSLTKKMQLDLDHAAIATKATQMVERLSEENRTLRQEIEGYYKRVTKLQQFEVELQKVQTAYEALVRHTAKRENMEKVMRYSLKGEIRRLQETNRELTDQLSKALTQLMQKGVYDDCDSDLKKELGKKDSMITKLISQNKELGTTKERLEIEVAAQRSTLQEQRSHIEVLDVALTNAQTNVAKLEEEVKRHATKEDHADQLQKIISQLQGAAEKREAIEKQLRGHLEEEIRSLKGQKSRAIRTMELDEGIASDSESPSNVQSLVRQLHEKEEKILRLEADVTRFEQRFLEESALRQLAVDAAAMPKDARIAALEQSSVETEKLIAEAHTDRLKHLEEVYQANRRCAELEAKVKSLQAQLAEKDAMITVLHKHSSLSRTGSISSLLSSPSHSPRPSLPASSLSPNPSPTPIPITIPILTTSSSPASEPSLPTSQLDKSNAAQGPTKSVHTKSNSTGSTSTGSTTDHANKDAQLRDLQHKLAAQAALFRCLQTGDQLSKRLWQV
jgi:DNA repair exonuclease SbcCD ATPase subunit